MTTIAARVIDKLGGATSVSTYLGLSISTVCRWTYPREAGGTAGLIPARWQHPLMAMAREHGVQLGPEDFFEPFGHIVASDCDRRKAEAA
jgi:hypothetical protein